MDIIYLFRTLLKKKWIILAAGFVAAGIAYILTLNAPKKYSSNSQISTGFTISDKIVIGSENFDMFEAETKFSNATTTISSASVVSFLSYALILHDLENQSPYRILTEKDKQSAIYKTVKQDEAKKVFRNKLDKMSLLTTFNPEEKKLLEFLALYNYDYKSLVKNLTIYRLQRTDYIQIEYSSENPELSAFIVNEIFQQFIRYYRNIRSTTSQESIDTLKSIMDKKKLDLDYKKALLGGGAIVGEVQSSSTFELISNFEQALASEKNTLTTLYASLRKIDQRLANLGVQSTSTLPPNNNEEILLLRKAMNDAYTDYLNSGSKDKDLFARYNQLKTEYQTKVTNSNPVKPNTEEKPKESKNELLQKKSDLEIDIQTTNANITSLQNKIGTLRGHVYSDAARGASAETLAKEAEQANSDYLAAKQKYNDAVERSSSSVNNFRQVLMGQPAISPDPSKRFLLVGMAGMSASILAILVIILLVYLDSSVKTPAIFSRVVNLKLISLVNFMNLKNKSLEDIVAKKEEHSGNRDKSNLGVFRESLRKLRYEIESSGKKTILFASTKKGQGKTTLIMGLSYSLSMSKKKILIIDTNFSNNDLTIEMEASPTLEKLNYEASKPESIIAQVKANAKELSNRNIFIIGSEGGDYTPSEILPRENILAHLKDLTNEFDYVFLEGPPLNDFSDAKELSAYVEGVIGVFSAYDIIKQIDKESINFFKNLNDKYIGSILNMVDLENVNTA